jgi:hypothetical protein
MTTQELKKKHRVLDRYSSINNILLLKGCSPLLAYDFTHNLYIAFVISRLVLVAGPSIALMNPKYFNRSYQTFPETLFVRICFVFRMYILQK